jgi:hypothetical protein
MDGLYPTGTRISTKNWTERSTESALRLKPASRPTAVIFLSAPNGERGQENGGTGKWGCGSSTARRGGGWVCESQGIGASRSRNQVGELTTKVTKNHESSVEIKRFGRAKLSWFFVPFACHAVAQRRRVISIPSVAGSPERVEGLCCSGQGAVDGGRSARGRCERVGRGLGSREITFKGGLPFDRANDNSRKLL